MDKKYKFIVKIDDGYCEWEYEFPTNGAFCIHDVAEAISDLTGAKEPLDGRLIRVFNLETNLE
jgi:hypothetical protein